MKAPPDLSNQWWDPGKGGGGEASLDLLKAPPDLPLDLPMARLDLGCAGVRLGTGSKPFPGVCKPSWTPPTTLPEPPCSELAPLLSSEP